MITVKIRGDEFVLQLRFPTQHWAVIAEDKRGGYVIAEVIAVHTHACIERRWGRKNHHKECNCGADELAALVAQEQT